MIKNEGSKYTLLESGYACDFILKTEITKDINWRQNKFQSNF